MHTSEDLRKLFASEKGLSWRTHKLRPISDVSEVLWYLLKRNYAVEIDGYLYDITFGLTAEGDIGYSITQMCSPSLCSYEVINKGLKEGKWFEILDEPLSKDDMAIVQKRKDAYTDMQNRDTWMRLYDTHGSAILESLYADVKKDANEGDA